MNIKSAHFLGLDCNMVRVEFLDSTNLTIIDSTSPPDWYSSWLAEGNTAEPAEE